MNPPGLSGYLVVRNGIALDYCFREAIRSLLTICDEVVVCDSDSTDGTLKVLLEMAEENGKIRVINYPFVPAVADREWYDRWLNFTRGHLHFAFQLQLDADEILSPIDSDLVREAAMRGECRLLHYVNFWLDGHHTTVWGDGKTARLGPSDYYMQSHGSLPKGERSLRVEANQRYSIGLIFHYGLLRSPSAFATKQKFMLWTLEGTTDDLPEKAVREGVDYMSLVPDKKVEAFEFRHPDYMIPWLKKRGRL